MSAGALAAAGGLFLAVLGGVVLLAWYISGKRTAEREVRQEKALREAAEQEAGHTAAYIRELRRGRDEEREIEARARRGGKWKLPFGVWLLPVFLLSACCAVPVSATIHAPRPPKAPDLGAAVALGQVSPGEFRELTGMSDVPDAWALWSDDFVTLVAYTRGLERYIQWFTTHPAVEVDSGDGE